MKPLCYGIVLFFLTIIAPFPIHAEEMDVKVIQEGSGYKYVCIDGIVYLENKNGSLVQVLLNKPITMGGTAVSIECVPCNKLNEWLKYYRK